jgi:hypothetical protein
MLHRPPHPHCCGVRDIELDTDLWYRPLRRTLRRPKARLGGLSQRLDTERLTTSDPFAVVLFAALALQRHPNGVDVLLLTGGRIGRDHRHGREEFDVHATSFIHAAFGLTIEAPSHDPWRTGSWGDKHGQLEHTFGHRSNTPQNLRDVPHLSPPAPET